MMPATARPLPRSPRRSICGRLMIDSTSPTSAVTGKIHVTACGAKFDQPHERGDREAAQHERNAREHEPADGHAVIRRRHDGRRHVIRVLRRPAVRIHGRRRVNRRLGRHILPLLPGVALPMRRRGRLAVFLRLAVNRRVRPAVRAVRRALLVNCPTPAALYHGGVLPRIHKFCFQYTCRKVGCQEKRDGAACKAAPPAENNPERAHAEALLRQCDEKQLRVVTATLEALLRP